MTGERARLIVDRVRDELLTPYGLRGLAPSNPKYRGRCEGDVVSRDSAYHQGTAWPWLIGTFLDAHERVYGRSKQQAEWLEPLVAYMRGPG